MIKRYCDDIGVVRNTIYERGDAMIQRFTMIKRYCDDI